jgi:hypothetical protein
MLAIVLPGGLEALYERVGSRHLNDGSPRSRPTLPGGWHSPPSSASRCSDHRRAAASRLPEPASSCSGRSWPMPPGAPSSAP